MIRASLLAALLLLTPALALETDLDDKSVFVPRTGLEFDWNEDLCLEVPEENHADCMEVMAILNTLEAAKNQATAEGILYAQALVDWALTTGATSQQGAEGSWVFTTWHVTVLGQTAGATVSWDGSDYGGTTITAGDVSETFYHRDLNVAALKEAASCTRAKWAAAFDALSEDEQHQPMVVAHALKKCSSDWDVRNHLRQAKACGDDDCAVAILDALGDLPCPGEWGELDEERGVYCTRDPRA